MPQSHGPVVGWEHLGMRRGIIAVCLLALAVPAIPAAATPAPVFRISDPRIPEASGIAAGIRSPGVVYVQNDSGDRARFFALDATSGRVLTEYDLPGVTAVDWEDIAVAPDAAGTPSVWLADIGDNLRERSQVEIYRVDEPAVDRTAGRTSTGPPDVWRLHYPGEPADAESLAVSPGGVPYLVTKSPSGDSVVYRAPPGGGALQRVGAIRFTFTGSPGPYAPIGQLTATGAALSRDGTRFVVRTYTDAYLWTVRAGALAAALRGAPRRIALPRQPQGEGVCFAGNALLIDSEGRDAPVFRIALPRAPSAPSSSVPPPVTTQPQRTVAATPSRSTTRNDDTWTYLLAVLAGVAIAGLGIAVAVRGRRS